jgi:outer membrane receptor protein involved in Fe transport
MPITLGGRTNVKITILAAIVVVLVSGFAFGQTQTAQLNGTITDQGGATVPGATVTVTNADTQTTRSVQTSASGTYVISNLAPGPWRIEVTAPGFQKAASGVLRLEVAQIATFDVPMQVGGVEQTVNVTAEAPLLESTGAQLGTVVTQQQIHELPLNGRNFTQLLTLTPGATPVSVGQNSGGAQVQRVGNFVFPAINGQSNRSNSFTLDGVYNNAPFMGTYAVAPSVDALNQFRVQSHSDQAEFGGVSGGIVNIVSKSGTNEYHGTLYEFLRNDALDARGFFTAGKPPLRQNQFGATLGGHIIRDRTFFFFSYEGFRQINTSQSLTLVPTPQQLGGDLSGINRQIYNPFTTRPDPNNPGRFLRDPFPGNQIPASLISPSAREWADLILPAPEDTGVAGFNHRNTARQTSPADQYSLRVDHQFSQSDQLWGRFTWGNQDQETGQTLKGVTTLVERPARNAGLNYTHLFGANALVNLLFGYSSLTANTMPMLSERNLFSEGLFLGFPDRPGLNAPAISVPTFWGGLTSRADFFGPQKGRQYRGDVTQILSNHTIRYGAELVQQIFTNDTYDGNFGFNTIQTADPNNTGRTGSDLASFLLGVPDSWEYRDRRFDYQSQLLGLYIQDQWKATNRLTVNLGLRWDLLRNPVFRENFPSTWDFNSGQFIVGSERPPACSASQPAPCLPDPNDPYLAQHVVFNGSSKIRQDDYGMFGPRLGLAYRLTPTTVIRVGGGILYDLQAGVMQQAQNGSGAWPRTDLIRGINLNRPETTGTAIVSTLQDPFSGKDPRVPPATPATAQAFFFDPNFENPTSLQWNIDLQKELFHSLNATIAYVGSRNTHLPIGGFYNTALTPGPGPVSARALFPWAPASNYDRSIGRSTYDGLQVKLEQRFSAGLSYLVAYTWSKTIDIASSGQFGVEGQSLQDPYNVNADRSVSSYDIPHNFSTALIYQLPFGKGQRWLDSGPLSRVLGNWQINAIVQLRSGQPFTPTMNADVANIGATTTRPDLIGDPHLDNPTPEAWFDKGAYAAPRQYTYGSSGRNQLRTDSLQNVDLSLFREDRFTERIRMQLRAEAFNLLNHATFGIPQLNFTNARFGQVTSTVSTARQIQLGLRFLF